VAKSSVCPARFELWENAFFSGLTHILVIIQ
jgi:hypothetical protein